MTALLVLAIAAAVAVSTWMVGWWGVALVALLVGAASRHARAASLTALGAAFGWGALLVIDARDGRLMAVATSLGGIFHVPGAALLLLTLCFAALLAWSAAAVGHALRRDRAGMRAAASRS